MTKVRPGGWAWIGLTAGVVTVDYSLIHSGNATMSEVFGNALLHPRHRWPVTLSWFILTLHLFGDLLPNWMNPIKRFDPIGAVARLLT